MSVYIPGMEMPTSCDGCWALDDNGDYPRCRITDEQRGYNFPVREQRMGNCPLVPIPEHGDLIDKQAFRYEMDKHYPFDKATQSRHGIEDVLKSAVLRMLSDAPTIIPASTADKEGEG